jgi:hypothetical protein
MDMLFAYPFSIQIIAALLAAVMVIFGGTRCAARRVRASIAERAPNVRPGEPPDHGGNAKPSWR